MRLFGNLVIAFVFMLLLLLLMGAAGGVGSLELSLWLLVTLGVLGTVTFRIKRARHE